MLMVALLNSKVMPNTDTPRRPHNDEPIVPQPRCAAEGHERPQPPLLSFPRLGLEGVGGEATRHGGRGLSWVGTVPSAVLLKSDKARGQQYDIASHPPSTHHGAAEPGYPFVSPLLL